MIPVNRRWRASASVTLLSQSYVLLPKLSLHLDKAMTSHADPAALSNSPRRLLSPRPKDQHHTSLPRPIRPQR